MICAKARERLQAYADGELAGPQLREVEDHLGSCEACSGAASRLESNAAFLRERLEFLRGQVDPDLGFLDAVAAAPRRMAPAGAEEARSRRPRAALTLAAVVLLAGVGYWLLGRAGPEEPGDAAGASAAAIEAPPRGADRPVAPERTRRPRSPRIRRPFPPLEKIAVNLPRYLGSPSQARLEELREASLWELDGPEQLLAALDEQRTDEKRALVILAMASLMREAAVRQRLVDLLATERSAQVRAAAVAALGHSRSGVQRIRVLRGLTTKGGVIYDEGLRGLLFDAMAAETHPGAKSVMVRVMAMSQRVAPDITRALVGLTRSSDRRVQAAAMSALLYGRPDHVRDLVPVIEDPELPVADRLLLVGLPIRSSPREASSALLPYLQSTDEEAMKLGILNLFAAHPGADGVDLAVRILQGDDTSPVRLAALEVAIARWPAEETMEVIERLASGDADEAVRIAAMTYIAGLRRGR